MGRITVAVTEEQPDINTALAAVTDPGHGAIDSFIGTVRNHHAGQAVTGITYDVHVALAKKCFHDIGLAAQNDWPESHIYIAHMKGDLPVGGVSIIIAVSTPHRAESFAACRFIIEEIKKRAPIWKQEHYETGKSQWLPGHSLAQNVTTGH